MLFRVVTAVTAALICTCPTIAGAMVVPESVADIPSSFTTNGTDSPATRRLRNPATAALADSMRIFARDPARHPEREGDTPYGITDPLADLKPPSLEELIIIASVDPSRYIGPDGRASRSKSWETVLDFDPEEERTRATIQDLAKALLNRNKQRPVDPSLQNGQPQSQGTGSYKYFQAMMGLEIDKEFISAASEVINPKVTPGGIVTLNLFGSRDFAFMTSPVSNNIQIVDFSTGLTLTVSHSDYNEPPVTAQPATPAAQPPQNEKGRVTTGSPPMLVRMLTTMREIAVHPLTILSIILLSTLGVVFRMIRGAEH